MEERAVFQGLCGHGLPHSMATLFGLELQGVEVLGLHLQAQAAEKQETFLC